MLIKDKYFRTHWSSHIQRRNCDIIINGYNTINENLQWNSNLFNMQFV